MGSGTSKDLVAVNKFIEDRIKKDAIEDQSVIKMLLLGAGESGKSTVLKQMRILHANGFTPEEMQQVALIVRSNIVNSIVNLARALHTLELRYTDPELELSENLVLKVLANREDTQPFSSELTKAIKMLWNDLGIQRCYERRSEFQFNDSTKYFLDELDRITVKNYLPTQQDILLSRVRTTGIVEVDFEVKAMKFRVFDVGGQRSERKKWIHCFDNVNAILFIVAMSEYDQLLEEDDRTNRLLEALALFASISNSQWFSKTSMLLFLNKKDLFEQKIKRVNITTAFPDYSGPQTYFDCAGYIQDRFCNENLNADRRVYCHQTCGTDTGQIQFVLDSSINTIIEQNLQESGLG